MKLLRLLRARFLEILVVGILVVKLGLAAFPMISKHIKPISVVKDSLTVKDAIAREKQPSSTSSVNTVLASNDSTKSSKGYTEQEKAINVQVPSDNDPDLEKIKEELVGREALIREREKKLEALRASVEKEINRLLTIQNEIKAHLEKKVAEREAKSKYLAKMYSSIKAKKAAKLLEELDEDLAVRVLKLMKPEAAGQILTYLDPKKAARLTKEFYYK